MNNWKKTTNDIGTEIMNEHIKDMHVFTSCTCRRGNPTLGIEKPYILTVWGFREADYSLIKVLQTKETEEQVEWDYVFYLNIAKKLED